MMPSIWSSNFRKRKRYIIHEIQINHSTCAFIMILKEEFLFSLIGGR